jgi:opacity protein-like surface antigen
MKNTLTAFTLLTALTMNINAQAEITDTNTFFVGLGYEKSSFESNYDGADGDPLEVKPDNLFVQGGFYVYKNILAIEAKYSNTVNQDEAELSDDPSLLSVQLNSEIESMEFYLPAKTTGNLYVKGKIGYAFQTYTLESNVTDSNGDQIFNDTQEWDLDGLAYGVAVGYDFSENLNIEAHYTAFDLEEEVSIDADISSMGIALNYRF